MNVASHIRRTLTLGVPLIGSLVAQMAIQLTDTIMLGRYDVAALAGQVLGSALFTLALLFGSGFGWAVTPVVAEADARGQGAEVRRVTRMALWLSAGFGAVMVPLFLVSEPVFLGMGQTPDTARIAAQYLFVQGWSIFPALGLMVVRGYLSGLGRTRVQFWAMASALVLNGVVNYALIFGRWGAPELGVTGAAIGSVVSTLAAFVVVALYSARATPEHAIFTRLWRPDWPAMARVFSLGWPIGLATLAEAGLFSASAVMMGWLGTVPLAAHGIAMQVISIIFMAHLGLSQASTIRVGNAVGRDDGGDVRRAAFAAFGVSAAVAVPTALILIGMPEPLIGLFIGADDPIRAEVMALGVGLLAAAAAFQLVDAAQVVAMGVLRGLQDTRGPMWIASLSYWVIGIPLAYVFGFPWGAAGVGVWLGMAVGLSVAAVALSWRFWRLAAALEG